MVYDYYNRAEIKNISNILYEDSKTKSQKKVGIKYKKNHLDISGNKFFPINKNKRMSNKITNWAFKSM